jgi:osmoprotectant transport system ATP-binding protein
MILIDSVSKVYADQTVAVDSISLEINKGEIVCLIGTSGCGKTTLLKMLNRLIEPTNGTILIQGENIQNKNIIELRRKIGYVIQSAGLMPHMTILRNVALPLEVRGISSNDRISQAKELLQLVNLPAEEYGNRYPKALSGGQKQRVGIARALIAEPPILLMDEPFGALDPITRSHLHQELLNLNQQLHKTIIIVTHDLAEAFKLADRIVLMNKGKIVQQGTKYDFLNKPVNDFVAEFIQTQMEGYQV